MLGPRVFGKIRANIQTEVIIRPVHFPFQQLDDLLCELKETFGGCVVV